MSNRMLFWPTACIAATVVAMTVLYMGSGTETERWMLGIASFGAWIFSHQIPYGIARAQQAPVPRPLGWLYVGFFNAMIGGLVTSLAVLNTPVIFSAYLMLLCPVLMWAYYSLSKNTPFLARV